MSISMDIIYFIFVCSFIYLIKAEDINTWVVSGNLNSASDSSKGDFPSCSTSEKQLLSNLFSDYFQSSGSCLDREGKVLETYESSRKDGQLSDEEKKAMEEFCTEWPTQCQQGTRSGRLFLGIGKKIAYGFQRKINKIFDFFTGQYPGDYNEYSPYNFQTPAPYLQSWQQPYSVPNRHPPTVPPFALQNPASQGSYLQQGPPYSPPGHPKPPHSPPLNLYSLLSSVMQGYPPPPPILPPNYLATQQHQPSQTRFSNPLHQVGYDEPCNGDNCPPIGANYPNPPATNKNAASRRSRGRRASCPIYGDVVFPMVGKSALDNSSINILQDFPHLIQPVFYRKCRSKYPSNSGGRCIQEYLPMNFFTSKYQQRTGKSEGPILPQEFVLVESGCRIEVESTFRPSVDYNSQSGGLQKVTPNRYYS